MSQFFADLWESIFTPGPTPTLLIATNVSFAGLQLVLFALLIATYSIHFVILSGISGGLWWAINWFARELRIEQEKARVAEAKRAADAGDNNNNEDDDDADEEDSEPRATAVRHRVGRRVATPLTTDSETEVEAVEAVEVPGVQSDRGRQRPAAATAATPTTTATPTASHTDAAPPPLAAGKTSGSRSGVSTEDEWEKVSENEK